MQNDVELQQMLAEIQQEKQRLTEQLLEYKSLKNQIIYLRDRAPTDPEAMKKLEEINLDIQKNGQRKHAVLMKNIGETKARLDKISQRLKEMFPEGGNIPGKSTIPGGAMTQKAGVAKKIGRAFV